MTGQLTEDDAITSVQYNAGGVYVWPDSEQLDRSLPKASSRSHHRDSGMY